MLQADAFTLEALLLGVEVLDPTTEAGLCDNTAIDGYGSCFDGGGVLVGIVQGVLRVLPLPAGCSATIKTFSNGNRWTTLARSSELQ